MSQLEEVIQLLASRLTQQRGFKTPYHLTIKPELPLDAKGKECIVIIKAGSPPEIFLSRLFVEACIITRGKDTSIPKLRDTVERSLEFLPKMYHTLALVPVAEAVALKKEVKGWKKVQVPNFRVLLNESDIEYTYAVTATDKSGGTSVTRKGTDISDLRKIARLDLSRLVIEDEDAEDYREMMEDIKRAKEKEVMPNEVKIMIEEGITKATIEY